ncbi:MAG: hypothetical protein IKT65_00045 [Clostridia bacterium]|nr:hypothetical protein [Clostridia bacterium]
MKEQIYTIPVTEAVDKITSEGICTCPMCTLYEKLENDELNLILGASMMEPDIRIKTNKEGFCRKHFDMMLGMKNKLGLALMMESHIDQVRKSIFPKDGIFGPKNKCESSIKPLTEHNSSCYICSRVDFHLTKMAETVVFLWNTEEEFAKKFANIPYFCLEHYRLLLQTGLNKLPKNKQNEFYTAISDIEKKYIDSLYDDVSWFCKKFDYRYADEPWGNAKDSVERAVKTLS